MILSVNLIFSQKKETKNTIKFNAITIFKQVYDLQYEKVINDKNSLQFGIGIGNYSNNEISQIQKLHGDNFGRTLYNPKDGLITEKTFSINVDYKHYYMKTTNAPRGLLLSPSIQYLKSNNSFSALEQNEACNVDGTFNYTKSEYKQNSSLVNIRSLIGCQLLITNLVCINPYIGPSYAFGNAIVYNGNEDSKAKGFLFNYGVYVGVGF
jgi:hypothetical protein